MYDIGLLIIAVIFMLIGLLVSSVLKSKFAKYSKEPLSSGLSGKDIAEKMLKDNGIYDVKVLSVEGRLTDHYNPTDKTVNLSTDVYNGRHIAAAAVAAHECGHAVQHATAYQWLKMRSAIVPVVQLASNLMSFLTFGLAFVAYSMPNMLNSMLLIFIILQGAITLFSLITLPVEVDASKRALAWLDSTRLTRDYEHAEAKDALTWAAYTYFVAALGSIATLVYYIWRFTSNNRD
ncbi:MAG: zinc metallopeptidase [Bacteroidota bacterium]|nr:zinc metallopeptidase [Bacteroidota bacterium]MDP3147284.1 zinc metallopeptidase [Bacteroidota bacterium]